MSTITAYVAKSIEYDSKTYYVPPKTLLFFKEPTLYVNKWFAVDDGEHIIEHGVELSDEMASLFPLNEGEVMKVEITNWSKLF